MIKKHIKFEDLGMLISTGLILGIMLAFNLGMGKWVLFIDANRYLELGMYDTAFYYFRSLINSFLLSFFIASIILFLTLFLIHVILAASLRNKANCKRYRYYSVVVLLFGLVLISGYHLNSSPWYPSFYSKTGLLSNAIVLFFFILALIIMKKLPRKFYLLAGASLGLLVLVANGYSYYKKSQMSVLFTDVSQAVRLRELHNSFGTAWGDYNNDGWMDVFISSHLPDTAPSLLYQNRKGLFSPKPMAAGDLHGVAWGDFDNNGAPDLFVAGGNNEPVGPKFANLFFLNDGTELKNIASSAAVDDTLARGRGGAWADFNNDGLIDLLVANYFTSNALFLNNGDGTFTNVAKKAGITETAPGEANEAGTLCTSWADYEGDGDMDLLTVAIFKGISLYRNNGDGTFSKVAANVGLVTDNYLGAESDSIGLSGCAWGDYDNDGDLDLYIGAFLGKSGRNLLFQNQGNGTFIEVGAQAGVDIRSFTRSVIWGDFNNDGFLDLYLVNQASNKEELPHGDDPFGWNNCLINKGDGTFTDVAEAGGALGFPFVHEATAAFADYDNDGFLDVLINNERPFLEFPSYLKQYLKGHLVRTYLMRNILLRNSGNKNNWLKIKLRGTVSNRDGIGTKLFLSSGGLRQFREQNGGAHTFAQNSMVIHFGMGKASVVDRLLIKWPSGITQTLSGVPANQTLDIIEPDLQFRGGKKEHQVKWD